MIAYRSFTWLVFVLTFVFNLTSVMLAPVSIPADIHVLNMINVTMSSVLFVLLELLTFLVYYKDLYYHVL